MNTSRLCALIAMLLTTHAAHAITPADEPLAPIYYQTEADKKERLEPAGAKLTALHFWATWCAPCVEELPLLDAAAGRYRARGFSVVPISMDSGHADRVRQFYTDHKITRLPLYFDRNNNAFRAAGIRGLPTTLFINAEGRVIGRADGPVDWKAKPTRAFIEKSLRLKPPR